ncbi:FUSC family protein [Acinetobacter sp. BY484]|uniref:FUSC family protein n=1 Tax=Acinetobacter sp. BY484 TaxID=2820674 RepID=UPI001C2343DE|nr:FUSC family protein [Acinetobacter sp. BY484]
MQIINKKNLKLEISFHDNGVFLLISLINSGICYYFFNFIGLIFGFITVLFSNMVYEAKEDKANIIYMWFLLSLVILSGVIGFLLKISIEFYLYIFILAFFYYIMYGKDPYIDRTFPFVFIYSFIGTVFQNTNIKIIYAYLTGITIGLLLLNLLRYKKYENDSFKNGFFSKSTYLTNERIFTRSITYSLFAFLSLYVPYYFLLYKPYWSALTFIILLRPKEIDVLRKTIGRFIGCLVAVIFIILLFKFISFSHNYLYLFIFLTLVFLLPSFLKMQNSIKSFGTTLFVILLIEITFYTYHPNYFVPISRVYETFIGGFFAIIASLILKKLRQ